MAMRPLNDLQRGDEVWVGKGEEGPTLSTSLRATARTVRGVEIVTVKVLGPEGHPAVGERHVYRRDDVVFPI